MPTQIAAQQAEPTPIQRTAIDNIALVDLQGDATRAVTGAWETARGWRSMPPRSGFTLASIGRAAQNISLLSVIGDGDDYEFRIIGDAHVRAYADNRYKRLSEVMRTAPRYGRRLRACLELVRTTARPYAFRGFIGDDLAEARFVWFETVFLPLGDSGVVDHVVNAAVYTPRGGRWSP